MGHRRTNKLFTEIMRENYIDSADDFRTILLDKINRTLEEKKKEGKQVLYGDKDDDLDDVDKSELKGKHADRDDKDIDNDGDVDSSDKFLHKKRKAITKAMKKESRCLPCEEKARRQEMAEGRYGNSRLSAYKAQQKRGRIGGGTARATRLQPNAPSRNPGGPSRSRSPQNPAVLNYNPKSQGGPFGGGGRASRNPFPARQPVKGDGGLGGGGGRSQYTDKGITNKMAGIPLLPGERRPR